MVIPPKEAEEKTTTTSPRKGYMPTLLPSLTASASNRTSKGDIKEDSYSVMLELHTQMSNNKDPNHETNKVKHTKFTLDCNAHSLFCYDYSESFLTFKKPVGKTHNCSNLLKGVKTKKKEIQKKAKKDKKIKKNKKDIKKNKKIL